MIQRGGGNSPVAHTSEFGIWVFAVYCLDIFDPSYSNLFGRRQVLVSPSREIEVRIAERRLGMLRHRILE
jgi:hypothetical protein